MLKNRIIPCLDVKNGRVVKGINFVDLKDAGDPVEQASIYDKGGADEICFLNIRELLLAGADKVSINTAAVRDMNFVKEASKKFGTQCMVVAVDAKKTSQGKWEIFTHGGRENTGISAIDFSKQAEENGAGEILLTSMDKDGTKAGYDLELLNKVTSSVNIPVIASGGAGKLEHLYEAIKNGGASAVLAASIFHYGEFTIKETKEYLKSKNVPVRL